LSIHLMSAAFRTSLPSTQKFVLVALADIANDHGECYPSVATLMERCSLSERAVQGALSALEAQHFLRRELRCGRSTVYWITIDRGLVAEYPRTSCTPADGAPRTICTTPPQQVHPHPRTTCTPPPHVVHP
jgi:hypothetical protein